MEYVKYFTQPPFDNKGFADTLNRIGVRAKAVDDGVILNRQALNTIKVGSLPIWVYLNKEDINSKVHIRPATAKEIADCISSGYQFMTMILERGMSPIVIEANDELSYLKRQADSYRKHRAAQGDNRTIAIMDTATGDWVYKV